MFAFDVIQPHPTWEVLDSSKLTTYMECPRKFFYRYIMGWRPDYPNNHLVFGSAWHLAMEHITRHGVESTADAVIVALKYYREHFPADTDELYEPKTPANLANSVNEYAHRFGHEHKDTDVLYTELAGLVLVSLDRTMAFKCDAILRGPDGRTFGLDHKTSQRKYTNWGDHWTMSTQMLTYLHALHCLYPDDDELQMLVRCAFFYKKTPTEFDDHPIRKSGEQMQAWLERVNAWIDRLEYDMHELKEENTAYATMQAFPMNDTACFNFGRQCEFFDFCNAWSNPLSRCEHTPIGFTIERWDPLARPEIKTKLNLATQSGAPVEIQE